MKCLEVYSNVIPSMINNIRTVVDDLIASLRGNCGGVLNDTLLFEIRVVLNEMLVNAIKHGNKEDEKKAVKIRAGISANGEIFVIIEDEGHGYDFGEICKNYESRMEAGSFLENCESGRGIMIIRGLCDRVKVNERGNKIIVTKRITAE